MYYIGIDVSKEALSFYDGKVSLEFKNQKGLVPLYRYLAKHYKPFEDIGIIFEATGIYSRHLKEFCSIHRIKCYILNPKQSHNFAKSLGVRSKSDKIDARVIWHYQSLIPKEGIHIPAIDPEAKMLVSYLITHQFFQVQRTSISNHLKSVTDKTLHKLLEKELLRKRQLEKKLLSDVKSYIGRHSRLAEDCQRLMTIAGIREKLAFSLFVLFRHYQGTNRSEITALVGMDPIYKESGTSKRSNIKVSKYGNRHKHKMLYLPTLCTIKSNQNIASFCQRLFDNHKPKKVAISLPCINYS